jgi:hypothetical protein
MRDYNTTIPTAPLTTPASPPTVPPSEVDVFLMEAGARRLLRRRDRAGLALAMLKYGLPAVAPRPRGTHGGQRIRRRAA